MNFWLRSWAGFTATKIAAPGGSAADLALALTPCIKFITVFEQNKADKNLISARKNICFLYYIV